MSENEILSQILQRVTRVETKVDALTSIETTADEAKEKATKALASSSSAHKRIDKIDKVHFWVGTTIIGAVIIGLLALLIGTRKLTE